jgi:hypothetical protein
VCNFVLTAYNVFLLDLFKSDILIRFSPWGQASPPFSSFTQVRRICFLPHRALTFLIPVSSVQFKYCYSIVVLYIKLLPLRLIRVIVSKQVTPEGEIFFFCPLISRAQLLYLLNSLLTVNGIDFPQKMKEIDSGTITTPPKVQKLERMQTIEQEHRDALERAVSLNIPHAVTTPDVEPLKDNRTEPSLSEGVQASQFKSTSTGRKTNWDEVVKNLFKKGESGHLVLNKEVSAPTHDISVGQPS